MPVGSELAITLVVLGVGGIPVLVTIYGFIREPVIRYIKNGNTGIP